MTTMIAAEKRSAIIMETFSSGHNDCSDNDRRDRLNFYHLETGGSFVNTSDGLLYVKVAVIVSNF